MSFAGDLDQAMDREPSASSKAWRLTPFLLSMALDLLYSPSLSGHGPAAAFAWRACRLGAAFLPARAVVSLASSVISAATPFRQSSPDSVCNATTSAFESLVIPSRVRI